MVVYLYGFEFLLFVLINSCEWVVDNIDVLFVVFFWVSCCSLGKGGKLVLLIDVVDRFSMLLVLEVVDILFIVCLCLDFIFFLGVCFFLWFFVEFLRLSKCLCDKDFLCLCDGVCDWLVF